MILILIILLNLCKTLNTVVQYASVGLEAYLVFDNGGNGLKPEDNSDWSGIYGRQNRALNRAAYKV